MKVLVIPVVILLLCSCGNRSNRTSSPRPSVQEQEACAKRADWMSRSKALQPPLETIENHFNPVMGRCFVLVVHNPGIDSLPEPGNGVILFERQYVDDAFENRRFAYFEWIRLSNAVNPKVNQCWILQPNGSKEICRSRDEFQKMVRRSFMD